FALICVAIVLGAPLSPVLTDLTLRRALVILPFACIAGAATFAEVLRQAWRRGRFYGGVAAIVLLCLFVLVAKTNYTQYFDITVDSQPVEHTFAIDYLNAAEYILTLPPDSFIIYFNERALYTYDTGAYIDRGI